MTRSRYTPSGRRRKSRTLRVFKSRRFQKSFSRNAKKKALKKRHYKSSHLTKATYNPRYANIARVTFYDSNLTNTPIAAIDTTQTASAAACPIVNLNCGLGYNWYSAPATPTLTGVFSPSRQTEILTRYMRCRPISAKVRLTFRYPMVSGSTDGPIEFVVFPYQSDNPNYSNYWNEATSPLGITNRIAHQFPYRKVVTLNNWTVKSKVTASMFVDFPKLYGMTRSQWLSDIECAYTTGALNTPQKMVKVCVCAYDLNGTAVVGYVMSVTMKQYCRFEGTQLKP